MNERLCSGPATPGGGFVSSLYSHSRLSSFENCRKQFHFRYVLRIPAPSEGVEAFVGKRVHEVLERLYRFVERSQVPSLERVLQRYHALWDENWNAERVRIVKQAMSAEHYRQSLDYYPKNRRAATRRLQQLEGGK